VICLSDAMLPCVVCVTADSSLPNEDCLLVSGLQPVRGLVLLTMMLLHPGAPGAVHVIQ
jgi:hypothetical protein